MGSDILSSTNGVLVIQILGNNILNAVIFPYNEDGISEAWNLMFKWIIEWTKEGLTDQDKEILKKKRKYVDEFISIYFHIVD